MSMTKLTFAGDLPPGLDVQVTMHEDPKAFVKSASAIDVHDPSLSPDKDHVGIHLVALGASEAYGLNRNFDGFTKKACIGYHKTFEKMARIFEHHRNKPEKNKDHRILGKVKKAVYNDKLSRVELFVHANKNDASEHLDNLHRKGEASFSMACRVPNDRCTICGNLRKNGSDPKQCCHIRDEFGKKYDDGRVVGTYNDEPSFFDISFVTKPADRIAWSLWHEEKAASHGFRSSLDAAEHFGVELPRFLAYEGRQGEKLALAEKLANFELVLAHRLTTGADGLAKSASIQVLDDDTIDMLRSCDVQDTFKALADTGVIMDKQSFAKLAFGVKHAGALKEVRVSFSELLKSAEVTDRILDDSLFDVKDHYPVLSTAYRLVKDAGGDIVKTAQQRAVDAAGHGFKARLGLAPQTELELGFAEKYAAYILSSAHALAKDNETALPIFAANAMVR